MNRDSRSHVPLVPAQGGRVDADQVEVAVQSWISDPSFEALVAEFGGHSGDGMSVRERVAELEAFSEVWDFRGGRERNLAERPILTKDQENRIRAVAQTLGMRHESVPTERRYDHCLILGGLLRACVLRPAWAAKLVARGVSFGEVTALGGYRPLGGDEPALAHQAGLFGVADELEAMDAGLRKAFSLTEEPFVEGDVGGDVLPNSRWAIRRYSTEACPLNVIAAPSRESGTRRANTADTYAWWAENIARLDVGHRVLLITHSIYVPFQHADAIRMLAIPYGCGVETVGLPPSFTGSMEPQVFSATNYLQEMRSTIRAFGALLDAVKVTDA